MLSWQSVSGLGVIGAIAAALSPGPLVNTPWVINPQGAPAAVAVLLPLATLATIGGLVCVLRVQIKWIVYGTCTFAVGYALTVVVPREWVPAVRVPVLHHGACVRAVLAWWALHRASAEPAGQMPNLATASSRAGGQ